MPRTARFLALGVLGCGAALACSDAFGIEDLLGVWNASFINDHAVPGTVEYEGASYDTEYVRWAFYEGGLCTVTQRVDGLTGTYDNCVYTLVEDRRTMTITFQGSRWDGSVSGNRMTLVDPQDIVWILDRQ
jgi:hypothetical protein